MRYISRKERMDMVYKKVEALYRMNIPFEDIARSVDLPMMDVLDIVQRIFAGDMLKQRRVG